LSHLSSKSSANLNASSLLIENELYASSVHCSYYAMLQHMTCKLTLSLGISFVELSVKSEDDERTSHKYILEETIRALTLKANSLTHLQRNIKIRDFQMLKRSVKGLKALRVESDYHDVFIDKSKSDEALHESKKVINDLNTYFI
jgi:hypothetical protein